MMFVARRTLTNTSIRFAALRYLLAENVDGRHLGSFNFDEKRNRRRQQDSDTIIRSYHVSSVTKKSPTTIILGLSAIAATAKAGQYIVRAYDQWKLSQPEKPTVEPEPETSTQEEAKKENTASSKSKQDEADGKRENIFQTLFNIGVGSKFYEGGFEEKMTRREAALILGVRETSTTKRIKEAHRKLLVINHPDTGGSTFLAGKINEAKELLMKGRREQ
jgi:DnaJ family protein C protein 19